MIKNIIVGNAYNGFSRRLLKKLVTIKTRERFTWGVVKSHAGRVRFLCSKLSDMYQRGSRDYSQYQNICHSTKMIQSSFDLLRCAYSEDPTAKPLTLQTVPSAYFHSQCLCVAYNDSDCDVKAPPQGVDLRLYCLSVLLKDFWRQVAYRPAVTYLDYAFQTRIPVCQFVDLIQTAFMGDYALADTNINVRCYFSDFLGFRDNCSKIGLVNPYNRTELCGIMLAFNYGVCEGDGDIEVSVPYYRAGDSPLVLFLTYLDVAVRLLTLVTYLACEQLRNLPGKLLIGYLTTALLRLLVVRASILAADMALAVRLDVASDLASTLCLTSYLHFLTVSIRDLRPPDSLSRGEARQVLLRFALLGWVLPAVLSVSFFWMDEVIHSRVQIGQLLFLLTNYVALLANLYMCFVNCRFYYDVISTAQELKKGVRKRDVFANIFNFAIKTSVLSGAGITLRLALTQIQGLEQLLSFYHALGTLQGLLVFLLYGCNHEARAFWRRRLQRLRRRNLPV